MPVQRESASGLGRPHARTGPPHLHAAALTGHMRRRPPFKDDPPAAYFLPARVAAGDPQAGWQDGEVRDSGASVTLAHGESYHAD